MPRGLGNNENMKRFWRAAFFSFFLIFINSALATEPSDETAYCVKISGEISSPQLYIVKRAIRAADDAGAKYLILDMDTPGGDLATTLEIMKALENFKGRTICYVNPEAISAGSFIATACDDIWFAPNGVMGAAEAVNAAGGDIDESMRRKITSYLAAKVRVASGENNRRADVQRAMNDPDFELKIGEKIIKKKGELLTVTAKEAAELYGGKPLLSAGTAKSAEEILKSLSPDGKAPKLVGVEITWAENAAKYISAISPVLMGIGFLLIFLEVKSGSFGLLGAIGVAALAAVFVGANISGMAGHEEILVFFLGATLVALEIFLFPGLVLPSLVGAVLMLGSLVWALSDLWPERGFEYNAPSLYDAIGKLGIGLAIAGAGIAAMWTILPRSIFWDRLVLKRTYAPEAKSETAAEENSLIGGRGVAVTDLMPSGKIEVGGNVYDAVSEFGHITAGDHIQILSKKDFNFSVKKLS